MNENMKLSTSKVKDILSIYKTFVCIENYFNFYLYSDDLSYVGDFLIPLSVIQTVQSILKMWKQW